MQNIPIPTYVINLADAHGRLAHMTRVLGEAGIPFERVEAIRAADVAGHPNFPLIPPLAVGRAWAKAEIACLLSHFTVWSRIAQQSEPFAAVFEDDLHIDPRLRSVLATLSAFPRDADTIKLETVNQPVWVTRSSVRGASGVRFARLKSLHHGGGAYVISRSAAQRLLGMIRLFDLPMDDAIFTPAHPVGRHLRNYQVIPALAVQDVILPTDRRSEALRSIIEPEREAHRSEPGVDVARVVEQQRRSRWFPLRTLPKRLVRALWRRLTLRLLRIPYGDAATLGETGR